MERGTEWALGHTSRGSFVAIRVGGMIETFCGSNEKRSYNYLIMESTHNLGNT